MSDHHIDSRQRLIAALATTATFFLIEVVAGFWTHSLTLLADAGHMMTDAAALALSLFAVYIKEKPATPNKSFGYHRTEVLVALGNGLALWGAVGVILHEAYGRFFAPQPVAIGPMLAVAALGLVANMTNMWILKSAHEAHEDNLNLRGAYIHVLSDSLGSVGVIAAGLIILKTGWTRADPLISALICLLILRSSWGLLKDSFHVLMEGTPRHLDTTDIENSLKKIPGVQDVHDLHVWSITAGYEALSGHLTIETIMQSNIVLAAAQKLLRERYSINHATLQIEEGCPAPPHAH